MSNGTTSDGFDFPCGAPDGEGYYVAAGLAEEAYYNRFGAWHTGEDWNGLGGGDSDLGAPIHATANGQVITSDEVWCTERDEAVPSDQIAGDCFEEAFGWKREDILD